MGDVVHEMRIELPQHVEKVLRDLAAVRGVSAEELALEALDRYLERASDDER